MLGRVLQTVVGVVSRFLVWCFYSTVRISGREKIPDDGPVLLVANHANALIDPVIVGMVTGRRMQFLARVPRTRVPVVRWFFDALGVIPLFDGEGGSGGGRFRGDGVERALQTLGGGGVLGAFPEGKSRDGRRLGKVSGAVSRIVAEACGRGVEGLRIVPVGINYDDKQLFRSVVWVEVGEAIDAGALVGGGASAEEVKRRVSGEIGAGLRGVVIHVDDARWEPFLEDLEVLDPALECPDGDGVFSLRQRKVVADSVNYFAERRPVSVESLGRALAAHRARLAESGLTVRSEVVRTPGWRRIAGLLWKALTVAFGLFPVVAGTLQNVVPLVAGRLGARVLMPSADGSGRAMARLLVGFPVFLIWYGFVWWLITQYFLPWLAWAWVVATPFAGLYALRFWRGSREVLRALWRERLVVFRGALVTEARERQRRLRERVRVLSDEYSALRPAPSEKRLAPYRHPVVRGLVLYGGAGALVGFVLVCMARVGLENPALAALRAPAIDYAEMTSDELGRRLAGDEALLKASLVGLSGLEKTIALTDGEFLEGKRSPFRDTDTDAIRQLMLAYLNHRNELLKLIWKYREVETVADERLRLRASLVGLTAGCALYQYASKFTALFEGRPAAMRTLNEGEPAWGIPAGLYDTVRANLANRENLGALGTALGQYRARRQLLEGSGLLEREPYRQFDSLVVQTDLGDVESGSAAVAVLEEAEEITGRVLYDGQAFVSQLVGNTRVRERQHGPLVTAEQVEEMRGLLEPGDILIERQDWFLSRAFMPGYWAHAALYVGDADDLRTLGLEDHEWVAPHWEAFERASEAGGVHTILEAVPQGVRMTTLEHCVGIADSAAVLRPRVLSEEEKRKMIVRAFRHLGKEYDFEFDFFSADKLVCTELVYRAYSEVGGVDFDLVDVLGRQTLPPTEMVRKFADDLERGEPQLELVLFLDGHARRGRARERGEKAFAETVERGNLTWLNSVE